MADQKINGALYRSMVIEGALAIAEKKEQANELNVFPVPDGDTGTNMSMTMGSAMAEMEKLAEPTLAKAADATASALLRGARGNSGVILSLLFRGMAKKLRETDEADGRTLALALREGVDTAYKAVMKPAEGTILTVSRVAAQHAVELCQAEPTLTAEQVLAAIIEQGHTALEETVHQNPVLEKAGVCEDECRRVNEVFFHYITHKTPFVTLKYAMTLDGKIAAHTGDSRWVTGETARRHVHETRNRLPAIMVGIGTVLADDPQLTCRIDGGRDPIRVICDSRARTPIDSRIVQTANKIPTYIAVVGRNERTAELERHGVHILECKTKNERLDLADLMRQLGALGIDGLLLEGGSALAFSALEAGVVHRVQAYIAPKIIGGAGAKSPVGGLGFDKMVQALPLKDVTCTPMDEDFLIEGRL